MSSCRSGKVRAVSRSQSRRPDDKTFVVGGAGLPSWRKGTILWLQMVCEVRRLVKQSVRFIWVGVPEWPDPYWWDGLNFGGEVHLMGLDDVVELDSDHLKALGTIHAV